jgi:hypothetical protein
MLLDFRRVFFCLLGFWLLFNIQLDTHQDMHFHSQLLASCHFKRHSSRHAFSFTLFIICTYRVANFLRVALLACTLTHATISHSPSRALCRELEEFTNSRQRARDGERQSVVVFRVSYCLYHLGYYVYQSRHASSSSKQSTGWRNWTTFVASLQ